MLPVTGCFSLSRASWYATSLSQVFVLCSAALDSLISSLVIGPCCLQVGTCADFIFHVVVDAQIVFALLDDLLKGG